MSLFLRKGIWLIQYYNLFLDQRKRAKSYVVRMMWPKNLMHSSRSKEKSRYVRTPFTTAGHLASNGAKRNTVSLHWLIQINLTNYLLKTISWVSLVSSNNKKNGFKSSNSTRYFHAGTIFNRKKLPRKESLPTPSERLLRTSMRTSHYFNQIGNCQKKWKSLCSGDLKLFIYVNLLPIESESHR